MKLKDLKTAYAKAVEDKKENFTIEGHELVVGYAKYLIQYLESLDVTDDSTINLKAME